MTKPRKKQSSPLRGAERAEIARELAELYALGSTMRSLAVRTGRAYGTVRTLLLEAGVTLRARGGRIRKAGA